MTSAKDCTMQDVPFLSTLACNVVVFSDRKKDGDARRRNLFVATGFGNKRPQRARDSEVGVGILVSTLITCLSNAISGNDSVHGEEMSGEEPVLVGRSRCRKMLLNPTF